MSIAAARPAYSSRGSLRRRLASAALALAVAVLIVALLILSGIILPTIVPVGSGALKTFTVTSGSRERSAERAPTRAASAAPAKASRPRTATVPQPAPSPRPIPTPKPAPTPNLLGMSSSEFAATDIGSIRGSATGASGASGANSRATYGPGEGPGGRTLYSAEWVREPTRAELAFYLPKEEREGWGMIMCQTIPRNRVDNCSVIGGTPGSGIARGLREAAWQFQVLPPRIDGRAQIGAWVRIRFDLLRGVVK